MYRSRIVKEASEAIKMRDNTFVLIFDEHDLFNWNAFLFGPDDSPYSQGIFEVKINLA